MQIFQNRFLLESLVGSAPSSTVAMTTTTVGCECYFYYDFSRITIMDDDDDDSTTTASTAFQPVHLYTNTEFHCLIAWCRRCGYGYWDTLDVDVDDLLIFLF